MVPIARLALQCILFVLGIAVTVVGSNAADFNVDVKFHINTQRHSYDDIVKWLKANIETTESLYSNAPALKIHPTFVCIFR